jgi:hypothetical protein
MEPEPPSAPPGADTPKAKRPKGRPKRADAPVVDWNTVDKLLVHGEKVQIDGAETSTRRFPSLSEIGERYGVSKNRIWQYSSAHKCFERRKETEAREQIRYDRIIAARRADARALGTQDVVEVVDDYIRKFRVELDEGRVRTDNPGDLERLVRLKQLLLGDADARLEIQGGLTLEALQARHKKHRGQVDGMTPELTGTDGHADSDGRVEPRADADVAELVRVVPDLVPEFAGVVPDLVPEFAGVVRSDGLAGVEGEKVAKLVHVAPDLAPELASVVHNDDVTELVHIIVPDLAPELASVVRSDGLTSVEEEKANAPAD